MIHLHKLDGCAPAPLAHYLKALGVLRIVSEQADAQARGWWEGERFVLASTLSEEDLISFLTQQYQPTPILNPWGGRSGFYADSSEKSARQSLSRIEATINRRLLPYREAVAAVRSVLASHFGNRKPTDEAKQQLISMLRHRLRHGSQAWLEAAVATVQSRDGTLKADFAPVFGTGGNEGSGSYTAAYMAAVVECVIDARWNHALDSTLFGRAIARTEASQPMGQFVPEGIASLWDLLLAFEGAVLLRTAAVAKRNGLAGRSAASPFCVRPATFGYASAARLDEFVVKQGNELWGRGEQWFPLWPQPVLLAELSQLLAEGRSSNRRSAAEDGWSMARAIASFGTRRGITQFVRYGYLQRNNQSLHFAVPLGRFAVSDSKPSQLSCLDDLDAWFATLRTEARKKECPATLKVAVRQFADACFDVLQHPTEPARWQAVLLSLAAVESVMRSGSGFKAQPVPPLRPEWVSAADDGSAEFRLALAFALQAADFFADGGPVNGVRRHWLPLDTRRAGRFATTGDIGHQRLASLSDVVMNGRDGVADAIALLERRLVEAAQAGLRTLPQRPAPRAAAKAADLAAWLAGRVDPQRTLALARALMALDRRDWAEQIVPLSAPAPALRAEFPDDAWLALRLACFGGTLPGGARVPCDPALLRRLASGDATAAVTLALRRLQSAGMRCSVRVAATAPATARLWAAALAFPITRSTAAAFARRLDPAFAEEPIA